MDRANLQVFFGEATEAGCRVYALANSPGAPKGLMASGAEASLHLAGMLRGPECPYAQTLPVTFALGERRAATASASLPPCAEAWIPDPCFWTPAMPYVYHYEVWQADNPQRALFAQGILGIRRLGTHGADLVFDNKRWVLRAARVSHLAQGDLPAWHEAAMVAVVARPDDALCEAASRVGVLLVATLLGDGAPGVGTSKATSGLQAELRRLAQWPAVGLVIIEAPAHGADLHQAGRNVVLAATAAQLTASDSSTAGLQSAWAQAIVGSTAEMMALRGSEVAKMRPIFAERPATGWQTPAEARAACDRLQRDLAAEGLQLAGYIV